MEKAELLACPFCGEVPVEGYRRGADWHKCESGEVYISCSSPKHEGVCLLVHGENFEQAAKDWNRRTPSPDNKALTVGELRERKKPVWCDIPDCEWIPEGGYYCLCDGGLITAPSGQCFSADECLKNGWVLLDRPPEKGGSRP